MSAAQLGRHGPRRRRACVRGAAVGLCAALVAAPVAAQLGFLRWQGSSPHASAGGHLAPSRQQQGEPRSPAPPSRGAGGGRPRADGRTLLRAAKQNDPEFLSLMAVGASGTGKSETCNTILGEARFEVSKGMAPQTQGTEEEVVAIRKTKYRVFDSAGFLEPDLDPAIFDEMMTPVAVSSDQGIDAFLLMFPAGRWGLENAATYKLFRKNFGDEAFKHTICVFTRAGKTTDEEMQREMRKVVPDVLDEFGTYQTGTGVPGKPRVLAMGELTEERRADDRQRLVDILRDLHKQNGGKGYDLAPAWAKVRERRKGQKERMEKLSEGMREPFLRLLNRERTTSLIDEQELEEKLLDAERIDKLEDEVERAAEKKRLMSEVNNIVLQGSASWAATKIGKGLGKLAGGLFSSITGR